MDFGIRDAVLNGSIWQVVVIALLAGAAVSLTSCTLVRLPFIVGHAHATKQTSDRHLLLAIVFSLGLIISYTAMGLSLGVLSSFAKKLITVSYALYVLMGIFLIGCGIFFADLLPEISGNVHHHAKRVLRTINTIPATFGFGVLFAFLEMPACAGCGVGMVLISSLVAVKGSVIFSTVVFSSFALGQSLPIIGIGASSALLKKLAPAMERFEGVVARTAGHALIVFGIVMLIIA